MNSDREILKEIKNIVDDSIGKAIGKSEERMSAKIDSAIEKSQNYLEDRIDFMIEKSEQRMEIKTRKIVNEVVNEVVNDKVNSAKEEILEKIDREVLDLASNDREIMQKIDGKLNDHEQRIVKIENKLKVAI